MSKDPIFVTQPFLPSLEEFIPYLEKIWDRKILTNGGPMHQEFERALCNYLGVSYISLFANGTLALVTALQSLRITGEVITTPYSFVATAHSLMWNGIKPIFVDIEKDTLNIDPEKIEAAITPQTTAIMPVHCYGTPCNIKKIQSIADNYNLKVIYDAAHAFGVKEGGDSILNAGDLSVLSFHATKIFNTFEGGAIISPDAKSKQRIDHLKNFGYVNETTVVAAGINGKMSEINAAFGLLQLNHVDAAMARRREIAEIYFNELATFNGITCILKPSDSNTNFGYFPILIHNTPKGSRDSIYEELKQQNIYCRRYFYPLITNFPMYRALNSAQKENLPTATEISLQVLCLPIYPALTNDDIYQIINALKEVSQHEK